MARVALRLSALIAFLFLVACSTPSAVSPASEPPPSVAAAEISGLFTVGSRKMYLECRGSGSPTVVLESGFRDAADIWAYTDVAPTSVHVGVAGFTRVCAYDRPGTVRMAGDDGMPAMTPLPSRSDPAPMPRTGADVVADLHGLLEAAEVPGPYIFAAHSLGGWISLLYARTYPDQVVGLVFVDATPPTIKQVVTTQQWEESYRARAQTAESLIADYVSETHDLDKTLEQLDAAAALPPKPVVMLTAAELERPDEELWASLRKAHQLFADTIPGARLMTVPDTTHYIHVQKPDAVIAAIQSLLLVGRVVSS